MLNFNGEMYGATPPPEIHGEYPPLSAEEMRSIAEHLETLKSPDNWQRIEDAQVFWIDKACEADRHTLDEGYRQIKDDVQGILGQ